MSLIADNTLFQNSFATLPLSTYQAGETVIADGSRTVVGCLFSKRELSPSSKRVQRLRR
jgi:hypothetical protein